ncbi:MAG: sigma 54-dependent Fis family transcriptional regulator [Labilithrix sp.]|nr:sigma 54-dependent Fis family transcriptional regulator [Labilithrix sp.]MCW5815284.1 sigma 54-dependent Fis family transcriptional regulator [Labilithrix sp.]
MTREEETRSLINRAPRDPDAPRPSFSLTVVSGADRGLVVELDGATAASRTLVGASPACTLRLTDPLVSRRHAAFEVEADGLRVQDLGSKNGTVVNGLRVTDALLAGGEVVRVGATMIKAERLARVSTTKTPTAMAFGRVVGGSPEMRRLYPLLQSLAASTDPVLIEGETGTGKELLAEALHEKGPRSAGPFVVFDCASRTGGSAIAALFGVEGGAAGVFEQARGGTLLLDEVAELEPEAQAGLLDALAQGRILREGARDFAPIDVRLLVATRRDLDAEVQEGRFREDVLAWLAPHRVELPPLRKRQGDVGLLARHFWRVIGGGDTLPADFAARLETYAWPGNVRELANMVARRFASGQDEAEAIPHAGTDATLGAALEKILESDMPFSSARSAALAEFEKRYVARVLARHGGHVGRAAAASGIARRYFQVLRGRSR